MLWDYQSRTWAEKDCKQLINLIARGAYLQAFREVSEMIHKQLLGHSQNSTIGSQQPLCGKHQQPHQNGENSCTRVSQ